ncbi:hypothetical protein NDU88_004996 [Pleurodeles waltl]|uniref:Uncharacterized protein n=1 Tax=Pleurodeles waltl TaxID=8319 RepID=A0AAV7VLY3_PLEWA|nr:hypothetical protein NDU88_004996 [Pleurodeles waltl]
MQGSGSCPRTQTEEDVAAEGDPPGPQGLVEDALTVRPPLVARKKPAACPQGPMACWFSSGGSGPERLLLLCPKV